MAYHNNYLAKRGSKTPIINLYYSKSYRFYLFNLSIYKICSNIPRFGNMSYPLSSLGKLGSQM